MAAPALGALSEGIRFQLRLFWLHALVMLARRGVIRVEMERRDADAADDVAVFYEPPGRNEAGTLTDADFFQTKFHRRLEGAIDHAFFTDATRTATVQPLLGRLAATWLNQRAAHPRCRLSFVTNWGWASDDPLRRFVRDDGHLDERFLDDPTRKVRSIRDEWMRVSGLGEEDFRAFLSRFRIYAPWATQALLDEQLRDRMEIAGLSSPALGRECVGLDDLGYRFLESGRISWDREALAAVMVREGIGPASKGVRRPLVAVRSFQRFAGVELSPGDVNVDLTDLFDKRRPRTPSAWAEIERRLDGRLDEIARLVSPVELALDCHLSIAWRLGMFLDPKSGLQVAIRQKGLTRGTEVWSATAAPPEDWSINDAPGEGDDVVAVISITHDACDDVGRSAVHLGLDRTRRITFVVPGVGPSALRDGAHASALADALVLHLRQLVPHTARHLHLFIAAPVSFVFLFGQRATVLGPATMYEFDFGNTRTYSPGLSTWRP